MMKADPDDLRPEYRRGDLGLGVSETKGDICHG